MARQGLLAKFPMVWFRVLEGPDKSKPAVLFIHVSCNLDHVQMGFSTSHWVTWGNI